MTYITKTGVTVAALDSADLIENVQSILDLLAAAQYASDASGIIIQKASLPERFFDLSTGFAGEVLQKFSNYRMKLAIVGDFTGYTSKSLKDFIYECNKGNLIFFKADLESAVTALTL